MQKKDKAARSTRQLMGIEEIKDYCIATRMGNLVFFIIKPTNISVLPDSSISARIYALLNVVKGQAEIEMLALNSKESFERNKDFYRERLSQEELPAVRRLLASIWTAFKCSWRPAVSFILSSGCVVNRSPMCSPTFPASSRISTITASRPAEPPSRISKRCWVFTLSRT